MRWITTLLLFMFTYLNLASGYLRSAYSDISFLCEQFGLCQRIFTNNDLLENPALSAMVSLCIGLAIVYFLTQTVLSYLRKPTVLRVFQYIILGTLFFVLFIVPSYHEMTLRQKEGMHRHAHDGGVVQTEEAIQYFRSGRNPYTESYYGTPMEQWDDPAGWERLGYPEGNPALHHLPYLPVSFLIHIPFQPIGAWMFGFYDARMLHWLVVVGAAIVVALLAKTSASKQTALVIILLNPLNTDFVVYGMNDWLVLFWLVLTVYFLYQRQFILAAFVYGLAFATKTFAWLWLPFILVYLYRSRVPTPTLSVIRRLLFDKQIQYTVLLFVLTVVVFIGPFLLWDPRTFLSDVVAFNTGMATVSYPIRGDGGFGFGTFVLLFNLVGSPRDYFPFGIFQLLFGLPVLLLFLQRIWKSPTIKNLILGNVALFMVIVYFSRFWHRNYFLYVLVYLLLIFVLEHRPRRTKSVI